MTERRKGKKLTFQEINDFLYRTGLYSLFLIGFESSKGISLEAGKTCRVDNREANKCAEKCNFLVPVDKNFNQQKWIDDYSDIQLRLLH